MSGQGVQLLDSRGNPLRADTETAHFAASQRARELRRWMPGQVSADVALMDEGDLISARAHDLERNNGIASGAIRTSVDNIVGTGLRLSAKPDYRALGRSKEWADEWARQAEAGWRSFANTVDFDAARDLTFGGMTVLQMRTCFLAGDAVALALWLDRPGQKWRTTMQAIDPARLSNPDGRMSTATLREGIEINEWGEKIAYHFRKSHPSESWAYPGSAVEWERVPARTAFGRRKVVHLYEKLRPGQSRGRSILTSVMGAFRMLDHYQRIELQTAVVNSMIAAFIETPLNGEQIAAMFGGQDGNDGDALINSRNGWDVKLEGAAVIPLHPGDKVTPFTPNRSATSYAAYVENVLRYIGAGIGMPYELMLKDFSKVNYASARAALMEAWRYFMSMREWLSANWCQPVYELWLEEAVSRGDIEAPDFYENKAAYLRAKWIGPGRGWIDPLKEAQAAKVRMEAGIGTLERECAEQGEDYEEVLEQRARENELAESLGLPPVHVPPPQGGAPGMDPAGQPGEDDDNDDEPAPGRAFGGGQ